MQRNATQCNATQRNATQRNAMQCNACSSRRFSPCHPALSSPPQVARVDAYKYPELASRYKIQGFPTLVLFEGGEPVGVHRGRRTLDALFAFVDKFFPN